jgi:hypothetical protein
MWSVSSVHGAPESWTMRTPDEWPELNATMARMEAKRETIRAEFTARTEARRLQQARLTAEQDADFLQFSREDESIANRIAAIKFARGDSDGDLVLDGPKRPWLQNSPVNPTPWRDNQPVALPPRRKWRPEPPRGNGSAKSRRPRTARSLESMGGLRGLVIQIMLDAGEAGLTAYDLPPIIEERARGEVLERFLALKDKVKNAADGLYVAREAQLELGLVVERLHQHWRIRKATADEAALRG